MTRVVPTAEFSALVHGSAGVEDDDPVEACHEATRLYPNIAPGRLETLLALARNPELQQTAARSSRTHDHRPGIELPDGDLGRVTLGEAVARRRSGSSAGRAQLSLSHLGSVLAASYRAALRDGAARRPVPSGGALYPLEIYVLASAVDRLEPVVAHYDPFRHRLAFLRPLDPAAVAGALVDPALAEGAAATLVITAMFWRSRFKYGPRGYRFALIEAGHVVQNALLAAAALGLPVLPVGGFYDRRLDALVGADGLDEASVYAVVLGGRE